MQGQVTLPDILPDIIPTLSNKNPQVKEGALKFLGRCLSTATTPIQSGQLKSLTDPLGVLLEDGFENARNEAAICLGTLMKMVGERPLAALMESLADMRKVKVKEAYEKATVKCKATGGPLKAAPPPPSKDAPAKKKAPAPKALPAAESLDEDAVPLPKSSAKKQAKVAVREPVGLFR
jgi:cytoskeleton-associated protein 5